MVHNAYIMPPSGNVPVATVASHITDVVLKCSWEGTVAMVILIPLFSLVCRSEGKTCGVCMEQVMAKLMRSERRFGIMCEGTRTVFLLNSCMHGYHKYNLVLNPSYI